MRGIKTTLLLGCGATRGALRGFHSHGCRVIPPMNSDFLPIIERFVKSKHDTALKTRLKRLKSFVYEDLGIARSEIPTMEDIFSMIYTSKDFPEVYKRKRGRKPKKFIEIEDFLVVTLRIFYEVEKHASKSSSNNLYRSLITFLENTDTIITLNYDTLLDNALMLHGWDARKGYALSTSPYKFHGFGKIKKKGDILSLKLLKLHGSFNWYTRKKKSESLSVLFTKKPSAVHNPQNFRWKEKTGQIRQIIPPIYGKFFAHSFWQKLWTKAFKSLISCDDLIVIGCSLVPTDFHIRALFGRVKTERKNKNNPFRKVIIVDPSPESAAKFKRLLRGCKKQFLSVKTFESYVQLLSKNKI